MLQEMERSFFMESEIQTAEGEIRKWKEWVNEKQSEANSREEELRLLKKEGEYESATNTTIIHGW